MKLYLIAMLLCLLANGCVGSASYQRPIIRWDRADTSPETFYKDRYACLQESKQEEFQASGRSYANRYFAGGRSSAQSRVVVSGGLFQACMAARGYQYNPLGRLRPPDGATVELHP